MKLSIKYTENLERPWLLKRENGAYEQHAHFFTKKEAELCRHIIDIGKYPHCKKYKVAIQRLLTEEEFKQLKKKQRYFNSQKGIRNK